MFLWMLIWRQSANEIKSFCPFIKIIIRFKGQKVTKHITYIKMQPKSLPSTENYTLLPFLLLLAFLAFKKV